MSYAIIRTGGKQYRVSEGDRLRVETLQAEVGAEVSFAEVLALGGGTELKLDGLGDKAVTATVVSHGRGKKIRIWKFVRRKASQTRMGHRQNFTEVQITGIPAA